MSAAPTARLASAMYRLNTIRRHRWFAVCSRDSDGTMFAGPLVRADNHPQRPTAHILHLLAPLGPRSGGFRAKEAPTLRCRPLSRPCLEDFVTTYERPFG